MTETLKLSGGRFQQADYSIGRYAAHPPAGTLLSDVLHPQYFQNHLASLKQGMVINVLSDDFSLDCDLRVLTVTKTTATMRVLRVHDAASEAKAPVGDVEEVKVAFAGPVHKWRITHAGEIIQHGFATQDEAQAASNAYMAKIKGN